MALRADPHPGVLQAILYAGYDVAWGFLALAVLPLAVFRGARDPAVRRWVLERLGRGLAALPRRGKRPRILIHGVSVGEVKCAQPIVHAIGRLYPGVEVVLSTITDTGAEVARKLFPDRLVARFPVDVSFLVRRFLRSLDPSLVVLLELEIWPNFLRECNRSGIPICVVNGRITEWSHGRYMVFRKLLPQFDRISFFCVQSEEYAERFRSLGVEPGRILVTGNVKADGLRTGSVVPDPELARVLGPAPGQVVLVAGSTHDPEERLLAEAWREAISTARLILVPRHPERTPGVVQELERRGFAPQLLSELRQGKQAPDSARPAIVDTIGELEGVYALADLVFVGGSLIPHGGQNLLEPAAQGKAVLHGPHIQNFLHEAHLLHSADACLELDGVEALPGALAALVADGERRAAMGRRAAKVVESQKGATELSVRALSEIGLGALASGASDDAPGEGRGRAVGEPGLAGAAGGGKIRAS